MTTGAPLTRHPPDPPHAPGPGRDAPGPCRDAARSEQLARAIGAERLKGLLAMVGEEAVRAAVAMRRSASCGELAAVTAQAHAIKGAAANFACVRIAEQAREIERIALAGMPQELAPAITGLAREGSRLMCELKGQVK